MALGLAQSVTEMSTRKIFLVSKCGRCVGLITGHSPGTVRACAGLYKVCLPLPLSLQCDGGS